MSSTGPENTTPCAARLDTRVGFDSLNEANDAAINLSLKYAVTVKAGPALKAVEGTVGIPPFARDLRISCNEGHRVGISSPPERIHHGSCPLRRFAVEQGLDFDQCTAGCVYTAPTAPSTT